MKKIFNLQPNIENNRLSVQIIKQLSFFLTFVGRVCVIKTTGLDQTRHRYAHRQKRARKSSKFGPKKLKFCVQFNLNVGKLHINQNF